MFMLKKIVFSIILIVSACGYGITGDNPKDWALGVVIGEPTGISLKYWHSENVGFALSTAWTVSEPMTKLYLHFDYLKHNYKIFDVKEFTGKLPLYYGVGFIANTESTAVRQTSKFGLRIPIGVEYIFKEIPFDFFAEICPGFILSPSTEITLGTGLGIRFFF